MCNYLEVIDRIQLPIELGDDEESDRIPIDILEQIGLFSLIFDISM